MIGIGESFIASYKHHFSLRDNPWIRAAGFWKPGVIRTEQALQRFTGDRKCLTRSGYFRDWIAPQGFRHSMGMVVDNDQDGWIKLTLYRGSDCGHFSTQEIELFRDLGRQIRILLEVAPRFQMAKAMARLSLRALDFLDFGVMLIDVDGRILEMNQFSRSLLDGDTGLMVKDGRVRAVDSGLDARLRALFERSYGVRDPRTRVVSVQPPEARVGLSLTLTPDSVESGLPGRLIFLSCPERAIDERMVLLAARFSLTPVEIELCRGLQQGLDLRRAGTLAGLTYETSRWYVKQLFSKTGTSRQADLVRVLLVGKAELALWPPE